MAVLGLGVFWVVHEEKTLYEKIEQALEDIEKIGEYQKARSLLDKVKYEVMGGNTGHFELRDRFCKPFAL